MSTYANRSFYETLLRIASVFFGLAVFLILDHRSVVYLPAIASLAVGSAIVWSLINKRSKLIERKEKLVVLDRSVGHILIDALNETCRTTTFSLFVYFIRSNFQFLDQGIQLSFEASVLFLLLIGYLFVVLFYLNKGRQERESLPRVSLPKPKAEKADDHVENPKPAAPKTRGRRKPSTRE